MEAVAVHITPERRIHTSSRSGNYDTVLKMLQTYPELDINAVHEGGIWTALHEACDFGHVDICKLLLDHPKIQVNLRDRQGRSGIFWAAFRNRCEVVWQLMGDWRVDVNQPNYRGETPIWKAALCGNLEVVKRMLAHSRAGLSLHEVPNEDSEHPGLGILDAARLSGNMELHNLLRDYMEYPHRVKFRLRKELGMSDCLAAEAFALVVFKCDGYLKHKDGNAHSQDEDLKRRVAAKRFFDIATRLPMDLQMVLCNRLYGLAKVLVLTRDSEPAFLSLVREFYDEADSMEL